jgi:hypothetical protein
VKAPLELQALQLEIVISEDTERETQRQALKVRSCANHGRTMQDVVFSAKADSQGSTGFRADTAVACAAQQQNPGSSISSNTTFMGSRHCYNCATVCSSNAHPAAASTAVC